MPKELKLGIRLTADGKGFVGEIRVAQKSLDKLTASTGKGRDANQVYSRSAEKTEQATRAAGRSFRAAHGQALKYFGVIGGAALISNAVRGSARLADTYTELNNRLRLVTDSEISHARVDRVFIAALLGTDDLRGLTLTRNRIHAQSLAGTGSNSADLVGYTQNYILGDLRQRGDTIIWQLLSEMDAAARNLPNRQILRDVCSWIYRRRVGNAWEYTKATCPYRGNTYFTAMDVRTNNPKLDVCSRRLSGCKLRHGRNLPFGGFAGVARIQR